MAPEDGASSPTSSTAPALVAWGLLAVSLVLFYPAPGASLFLTAIAVALSLSFVRPSYRWWRRLVISAVGWLALQAVVLIVLNVLLATAS